MTITAQTSKTGPYNGNGTTTVFSYTFEVQDEAHLVVTLADATGVETVQVLNTDYTVSGVGNANGGQITMTSPPATGYTLTIFRDVPLTQDVDLENRRSVAPEVLEDAYDKLTQIAQDLNEELSRTLQVAVSQPSGSTALSSAVAGPALLGFDAADNLITYSLSPSGVVNVASDVSILDAGNYYAGSNVEAALQEAAQASTTIYTPAGVSAVTRTVQDRLRDFVSVKDFGAVADGVTDDTAAITAAIAASIGIGKNLLIPPGKYVTSSTIKFDSTTLSANDRNIISLTVEASGATFIHTGTDVAVHIEMSGFAEKEIRGLTIDHKANNNAQGGFLITNSPRTNIRNTFVLCTKPNVATYYGYQVRVSDADFGTYWLLFDSCGVRPNSGGAGDYCPIGFWWHGAANATTMRNCFVSGTEGLRISPFSPVQTSLPGLANGCVVDGCWFEDGTAGNTAVKIFQDNRVTSRKSPPGFRFVNNRIERYVTGIDIDDIPVNTSFNDADYPDISHNHFVFVTTPISNVNDVPVFFLANSGISNDAQMPLVNKTLGFRNPFNDPDPVITTFSGTGGNGYHAQFGDAGYASNFDNYLASGTPGPSFNIGRKASGANPGQAIAIASNQIWFKDGAPSDSSNLHHNFQNTGVAYNTTGTWGTISDARFKENIEYLTDADRQSQVDDIRAFKFARYNLIGKGQRMLGVIAQDVEQISPGLVETRLEQDDLPEMKQVKQSIIHQKAVVALQVALDKIDALEQRIAQLEGGSA